MSPRFPKKPIPPGSLTVVGVPGPGGSHSVSGQGSGGLLKVKTYPTNRAVRDIIGDLTSRGEDVILFMVQAMKGQIPDVRGSSRLAAAEWLGHYLFGKPVETSVQLQMDANAANQPFVELPDGRLEEIARGLLSPGKETDGSHQDE
jgi:hypothetical protein